MLTSKSPKRIELWRNVKMHRDGSVEVDLGGIRRQHGKAFGEDRITQASPASDAGKLTKRPPR